MKKKSGSGEVRPKPAAEAQLPSQGREDSRQISARGAAAGSSPTDGGPMPEQIRLTKREIDVLRLMAIGLQNKEIGAVLSITEGTVKIHVHNILSKLDVSSRSRAIARVLSEFLL
jgi:two-component system nitrate/nitrite response regulator NarL